MPITISTWQSLFKMPKQYFEQYDVIVGDECHLFKAKSLTSIMTKLVNAEYRFGTTGTLDDTQTHKLVLEGLFGRVKKVITTKELIDKNQLAKFDIKAITLKYPEQYCKTVSTKKYHEEIDFLVSCPTELREKVRAIVESEKDAIIVASYGVYSTGVNIKNLHNIIFSHPGKSKIRVLQSIGRGLRTSESKSSATLYDIVDDLSYKAYKNFAVKHFVERYKYYMQEQFPTKIYKVDLKF
jgi:superfamily II DNA or RNA helicase